MKQFSVRWASTTVALLVATIIPGIRCQAISSLLLAGFILTVFNALVRPVLMVLSLPLIVMSLGLFYFVVNALVLCFAGALTPGFHVDGFFAAILGSMTVSVVSGMISAATSPRPARVEVVGHQDGEMKVVEGKVIE